MCAAPDAFQATAASRPGEESAPATTGEAAAERFLIACLGTRLTPGMLAAARALAPTSDAGWQAVAMLARQELLAPLLYRITHGRDLVPVAVDAAWRGVYHESLRQGALQFHALEQILSALAAAGVSAILLKGAALIETIYGNAALRPMTDLDLLVRPSDVTTALQILRHEGFATDEPFADFAEVQARKLGPAPILVELHWTLLVIPQYRELIDLDWLWQAARPVTVGAAPALVLGPEAQLLHLCAHLVLQHRDGGRYLLWRHDVAEVLRRYSTEMDWQALFAAATRFDLVLPLQQVLPEVTIAYGLSLPSSANAALAALRASPLERNVHHLFRAAAWSPGEWGWVSVATLPGWRRRLSYFWANAFPSRAYMRHRYQIRCPALLPVYYLRRWLEGVVGIATLLPELVRTLLARRSSIAEKAFRSRT